jgi:hypothetical protein
MRDEDPMNYRFTTTDGRTFDYVPAPGERPVSSTTSIDGYVFRGGGYMAAVTFWLDLYSQPGYRPNPPACRSVSRSRFPARSTRRARSSCASRRSSTRR